MKKTSDNSFLLMFHIDSEVRDNVTGQTDGKPFLKGQDGNKRLIEVLQIDQTIGNYMTAEIIFLDEIEEEYNRFRAARDLLHNIHEFMHEMPGEFDLSTDNCSTVFKKMKEISQFLNNNRL
jgi:hypothetical protein